MSCSVNLAFIESPEKVRIFSYSSQGILNEQLHPSDSLQKVSVSAYLYPEDLSLEEMADLFSPQKRHTPFFSIPNLASLNNYLEKNFYSQLEQWVLERNLETLNELIPTANHLASLFPKDRTSFFEELWFVLKNNLCSQKLCLIYDDLLESEKEGERPQLIRAKVEGESLPLPEEGGEAENAIMDSYKPSIQQSFSLADYDMDKGELVLLAQVYEGPIVIMAKAPGINKLQLTLFRALFDAINALI